MTNRLCKNCQFWKQSESKSYKGECRVEPPTLPGPELMVEGDTGSRTLGHWPETLDDDWCGRHKWRMAGARHAKKLS